jgi:cell wall-associated NlpC family hydrolase
MTDPEPGDFELTKIAGEGGELIRIGQLLNGDGFEDYEHARLYLGGGQVLEAEPGGARIAPVGEVAGGLWSTGKIPLTGAQRTAIVAAARGYVGTPYSAADYFALAAHRLHLPLPGLKAYVASSGRMICSQLVDRCYQDAGVHLFNDNRWPGYVTPGSLAGLLLAR